MFYQLSPAPFFYKQVSRVIGETMSTMTLGAGRYRQGTQFAALILESARYKTFFEPCNRMFNCIAWVLLIFLYGNLSKFRPIYSYLSLDLIKKIMRLPASHRLMQF